MSIQRRDVDPERRAQRNNTDAGPTPCHLSRLNDGLLPTDFEQIARRVKVDGNRIWQAVISVESLRDMSVTAQASMFATDLVNRIDLRARRIDPCRVMLLHLQPAINSHRRVVRLGHVCRSWEGPPWTVTRQSASMA
jgi:hypothetical protein